MASNLYIGPCKIIGCERRMYKANGLCPMHNWRKAEGWPDWATRPIRSFIKEPCIVCGQLGTRNGQNGKLCEKHQHTEYCRLRNGGEPLKPGETITRHKGFRVCAHPRCGRKHAARGYCATHDRRKRAGEPMNDPIVPHTRFRGSTTAEERMELRLTEQRRREEAAGFSATRESAWARPGAWDGW